jgi:hypothetical protein
MNCPAAEMGGTSVKASPPEAAATPTRERVIGNQAGAE